MWPLSPVPIPWDWWAGWGWNLPSWKEEEQETFVPIRALCRGGVEDFKWPLFVHPTGSCFGFAAHLPYLVAMQAKADCRLGLSKNFLPLT